MSTTLKISQRLRTIASFITPNTFFADIGSDHAYLPCYVCMNDKTIQAIAGEVKNGPFLRAKETVEHYGLTDQIDVRLGNGLEVIGEENISDIVIAGMGGSLIANIIEQGKDKLKTINRIIVQPNTNSSAVREVFLSYGFALKDEMILEENNHIYEVLVAEQDSGVNVYNEMINLNKQLMFGPLLMQEKSPIFIKKWQQERTKLLHVMKQMKMAKNNDHSKLTLFEQQLRWIEEVLS